MAHFAELDSNNVVQKVIVVSDKNTSNSNGEEVESIGIAFCKSLYGEDTNWVQCSRSGSIRGLFPDTGYIYNSEADIFHCPSPFPSWTLDSNYVWQPPVAHPELTDEQVTLGYRYFYNEDRYNQDPSITWRLFTPQVVTIDSHPTSATVTVGEEITVSTTATVNEGNFFVCLEKNIAIGDEPDVWAEYPDFGRVNADDLTFTFQSKSGITTNTELSGEWRVAVVPELSGIPAYSDVITITVSA